MLKEFVVHLWPCVFYLWVYLNAKILHASLTSLWLPGLAKSPFYGINLHVKLVIRNSLLKIFGNIFILYSKLFLSECLCCTTSHRTDFINKLFNSIDRFNNLPTNTGSYLPASQFDIQQGNFPLFLDGFLKTLNVLLSCRWQFWSIICACCQHSPRAGLVWTRAAAGWGCTPGRSPKPRCSGLDADQHAPTDFTYSLQEAHRLKPVGGKCSLPYSYTVFFAVKMQPRVT